MMQNTQQARIKKIVPIPKRYVSYVWYEVLAIVLFIAVFIYVASLQFFTIEANVGFISCRSARTMVSTGIAEYRTDHPLEPIGHPKKEINLKRLFELKYIRYYPKCWNDGVIKLNVKDEVYCTYHCPELEDVTQ